MQSNNEKDNLYADIIVFVSGKRVMIDDIYGIILR